MARVLLPKSKSKHKDPTLPAPACIRLRGVRQNNLKGFDLDLPLGKLIVITGLSGSGKSSLAFETLYAEGQRRYIETFTPYARQFFDRMDKPAVDRIENIPPAIAIEQRNAVRSSRSTVGTMTEICDYLKVIWPHWATRHCRQCGRPVRRESPQDIWELTCALVKADGGSTEVGITFNIPLTEKLSLAEQLNFLGQQGFRRLWIDHQIVRLEEAAKLLPAQTAELTVVADRIRVEPSQRSRFVEACEQAYHFGRARLQVVPIPAKGAAIVAEVRHYSAGFHCAVCDLAYPEPTPALFSFNNPVGACPTCKGFGRVISIDPDLALPDRSKTLAEGVVKPWQSGMSAECQEDLLRMARQHRVPVNVPFSQLSAEHQRWVLEGDPDHDPNDPVHSWPNSWYGVRGYFRWLETKSYKMHVRVLLSRYRSYRTCGDCRGERFNPDSLLYRLRLRDVSGGMVGIEEKLPPSLRAKISRDGISLAEFYALPIRDALCIVEALGADRRGGVDGLSVALGEVRARLGYLDEVGLAYLTLDRATRTLSGGETERVNLTTCLGTRLTHALFVLDEPSVGLHPRDTHRLIGLLHRLRDAGNTVVVVEHEASIMQAADLLVDLGPGHGEAGGQIVFQGSPQALNTAQGSLTADYLLGRKRIEVPSRRAVEFAELQVPSTDVEHSFAAEAPASYRVKGEAPGLAKLRSAGRLVTGQDLLDAKSRSGFVRKGGPTARLHLRGAAANNLRQPEISIPLGRLVCLTGVSGSGKTTLAREVLLPLLQQKLAGADAALALALESEVDGELQEGARTNLQAAELFGAENLGAVVLVDQSPLGRTPRSNPGVYIGAFDDIRDVFAASPEAEAQGFSAGAFSFNSAQGQCERCRGAGFEKIEMQFLSDVFVRCPACQGRRYQDHILAVKISAPASAKLDALSRRLGSVSIADLLEAPVEEVTEFLERFTTSKAARRAAAKLRLLGEVGLGYLRLGQPVNTLSGGESQRLKLVSHLVDSAASAGSSPVGKKPTLFVFDEPTTGLHFEDVRILLEVFQRLVNEGHSVLVIEHHLEVIRAADWILDLGPEAGDGGGALVVAGPPEVVAACAASHTGRFLREMGIAAAESKTVRPQLSRSAGFAKA